MEHKHDPQETFFASRVAEVINLERGCDYESFGVEPEQFPDFYFKSKKGCPELEVEVVRVPRQKPEARSETDSLLR